MRGGTGGRSVKVFPLAAAFSLRLRHCWRWEKKERADPRAALIAARRNIAGRSSLISSRGITGVGFFWVV